jgi:hypothetical protein
MPFGSTAEVAANPSPTPPPEVTETPTPTAEPGSTMPNLLNFAVTPATVLPGDTVTVSWDAASAGNVGLMVKFQADYRLFLDMTIGPLPAAGSQAIVLPTHFDVVNTVATFELYWANDVAPENWVPFEGTTQTVQIGCPTPLFWDVNGCAYAPMEELPAVYQPFERGFMVRAGDAIYAVILNEAHEVTNYAGLEFVELGTPPEGLLAPDAAFVDLWTSSPLFQEKLGWATGPAENYTAHVQTVSYHIRDTSQTHGITLPDGRTILLTGSAFGGPAFRWDWAG